MPPAGITLGVGPVVATAVALRVGVDPVAAAVAVAAGVARAVAGTAVDATVPDGADGVPVGDGLGKLEADGRAAGALSVETGVGLVPCAGE